MALNFPNSPTLNQIYQAEGSSFRWNGLIWIMLGSESFPWATQAEAIAGTVTDRVMSPALVRQVIVDPAANRIINGDMGVWQRGISSIASAYGSADRWAHFFVGGSVTTSRQAFDPGDTLGANQPSFFLRQVVSGQTGTNWAAIQQRIEGVRSYAGQTITIMGWARRSSGAGNLGLRVSQSFGTGGGASADVALAQQIVTLTGSWQPFAVTFNIPSLSGKVVGTSGTDMLNFVFDTSTGGTPLGPQTIGVDFWGIHIRQGVWTVDDIGMYRPRDPGTELALCQRYYWKPSSLLGFPMYAVLDSGLSVGRSACIALPVTMRATPTVAYGLAFGTLASGLYTPDALVFTANAFSKDSSNSVTSVSAEAEL